MSWCNIVFVYYVYLLCKLLGAFSHVFTEARFLDTMQVRRC